jgi:hypothetical protein
MAEWTCGTADWLDADWCARARLPCRSFDHQIHAGRGCAPSAPHSKPRRHGVDAVITARKEHVAGCDRSGDQQGNAVVDRFRGAIADHQPHTLSSPARLAVIDRTKGSTESVGLGGASGITLDTIAVRWSPTKIWASPIWICRTKDRTSSRSSRDASLVQRSASFADRSSTARWVAASRPSGATASLTSTPDAKSARRRRAPALRCRPPECTGLWDARSDCE